MNGSALPVEIWRTIFEYDSTYRDIFADCLDEVPDEYIFRTQCRRRFQDGRQSDFGVPIKKYIDFTLWLYAGDSPYIDIRLGSTLFIYEFTTLSLITPGRTHRFIYENSDTETARQDGIDTRLRPWEWWIRFDRDDRHSTVTWVSCSYHQIHGYLFETRFGDGFTHLEVSEMDARRLYKIMTSSFLNFVNHLVEDYRGALVMPGTVCVVPNARFRVYKASIHDPNSAAYEPD
jgi:hypothetical protein